MGIKINNEKYETRAFDCWPKMKELRSKHFWHTWNAQKENNLVVLGMYATSPVLCGIGDFASPSIGVHFTRLARTPNAEGLVQAIEAAEAWGLGRDVCGAMKEHLGQLLQGMSTTSPTGEKIKHDLALCTGCYAMIKSTQIGAEYLGVPTLFIDRPSAFDENGRQYFLSQMQEAIEWLEKKTGREYDDEKLIEGVKNQIRSGAIMTKCFDLLRNIPTPASVRDMYSLRIPVTNDARHQETVDYANSLYDELKYRVANKISSRGVEKVRLTYENVFPFHRADVLRSPEFYGALFVYGRNCEANSICSIWEYAEDGTRVPAKTLEERGIELRSREDALKAIIDYQALRADNADMPSHCYQRTMDYRCGAVVIQYDRTCQLQMIHTPAAKLYLEEKGVPVGTYSCPQGDPREFDERRVYRDLNTFYESLGLTRAAG